MFSGVMTSVASASGPFFHVGGTKLSGTKQIKLQSKGSAVFKSPSVKLEIECNNSVSEGATIEGGGETQGQAKGRVSFSSCKVLSPKTECEVNQPIVTNQLKSYLAISVKPVTQTKDVEVFEPSQGVQFTELTLTKCSLTTVGVTGSIAAELIPVGVEGQEGLVVYPATAITEVNHEGVAKKVKFETVGVTDSFVAAYGARLATFPEKFGIFEQ
jgi:hypothetical protein